MRDPGIDIRPGSSFRVRPRHVLGYAIAATALVAWQSVHHWTAWTLSDGCPPGCHRFALEAAAAAYLPLAVVGPVAVHFASAWWRRPGRDARQLVLAIGLTCALAAAYCVLREGVRSGFQRPGGLRQTLAYWFVPAFLMIAQLVALGYGLAAIARVRMMRAEARDIAPRVRDARMGTLDGQLAPHFLFNALNSAAALLTTNPAGASRMFRDLAVLMSARWEGGAAHLIPVREEFEFATAYLAVERIRFADRMSYEVEIAPAAAAALLPRLVLQPLVENAVHHGVAPSTTPCTIRLAADASAESRLVIRVEDSGAGLSGARSVRRSGRAGGGVGLRNVRARLESVFGADYSLRLEARAEGGTVVILDVPRVGGAESGDGTR